MGQRRGKTVILEKKPRIIANAGCVGKKEGEGPLKNEFDRTFNDDNMGQDSWEKAESELLRRTVSLALEKAAVRPDEVDAVFSGDLLNQCTGSTFGLRALGIPFVGLYGACSTMALGLVCAGVAIESGGFDCCLAATVSHFCSSEKQYRTPLEYGGQRTPTSQWTVTGAGAAVLKADSSELSPCIGAVHVGTILDMGITDANNMGAAMAPAAKKTIADFLRDTGTAPSDYDMILTGDLGAVGSQLLCELMLREDGVDLSSVHKDCGLLMFDRQRQDVHAGGSGCGCSASILCSYIINSLRSGKLKKVLFAATGSLHSPVSALQGESIPGISHTVLLQTD